MSADSKIQPPAGKTPRTGHASILGLPNAGKSTLVNALVGEKISIVSKKPQTTRCRILGITHKDEAQIVLIDTPGIFSPGKTLERAMVGAAWMSLDAADAVVHLVDAARKNPLRDNEMIIKQLPRDKPCILALNKIDCTPKPVLLDLATSFMARFEYHGVLMISALKDSGAQDVLRALVPLMPQGEWLYDPEQTSTIPMRFLAAEITREKIFHQLHEELPYAAMVETEAWEEFDNGDVRITQAITVQRDTQRAIVLGKSGARIKAIGAASRLELEEMFQRRVHLKLFVKVDENWSERRENLSIIGLDEG